MPELLSVGMPEKKASKAASPPADAPIQTIENPSEGLGVVSVAVYCVCGGGG